MTYYEELGLPPEAPVGEIRQAYRVLARLVHPDVQADAQVRGMAERQMQRLNEILETLSDPRRRREYDGSLRPRLPAPSPAPVPAPAAAEPPRRARFRARPEPFRPRGTGWAGAVLLNWFWIVPGLMILGVGCWYMAADSSRPAAVRAPLRAPLRAAGQAQRDLPGEKPRTVRGQVAHPPVAGAAGSGRAKEPRGAPVETARRAVAAAAEVATVLSAPVDEPRAAGLAAAGPLEAARDAAPAQPVPPARPSFAGNWVYVPRTGDTAIQGIYPPVYVECLLTEERGELSGSYRAQYRIPDRAVSQEVRFKVRGKTPDGESATLEWASPDGARGEVELRLHGPNAMNVAWWTSRLGTREAMASGTALLLREREP